MNFHRLLAFLAVCLGVAMSARPAVAQEPEHDMTPPHQFPQPTARPTRAEPPPPEHDTKPAQPKPQQGPAAPAPQAEGEEEELPEHEPLVVKVGIQLEHVSKFDVTAGVFHVELELAATCNKKCDPKLAISNGRIIGKMEVVENKPELNYKKYRLKAEIDGANDFSEFPFDQHDLLIVLENKADPAHTTFEIDPAHTSVDRRIKVSGYDISRWGENPDGAKGHAPDEIYYEGAILEDDIGDGQITSNAMFDMHLTRTTAPAFIKSIVPLIAMLFGVGISLLLRPKSIGPRFAAAASGLVPLVTFHVAQVLGLPPGVGLTRFDKFMVMTYIVYLIHHMFNVAIMRSEEVKDENRSKKLHLVAAGLIPGLALVLWMLVFVKIV